MSDLISRSELLRRLEEWNTSDEMDKALYNFAFHRIIEQPKAYDIDSVVAELEKELEKGNIAIDFGEFRLFEIVKQGGVPDNVCEWKSYYDLVSDKYKRETSCGYTFYDSHHAVPFNYCPYCGKKIKE